MKTETNTVESCLLATRQYNHLVIRVTLFWSEQNLSQLFSCLKKTPSTDWLDVCGARYHLWQVLAFVPLLTSSPLNKIASRILKFCKRKRSFQWYPDGVNGSIEGEICTRMLKQNFPQPHLGTPDGWEFPLLLIHSKEFFNWKQA